MIKKEKLKKLVLEIMNKNIKVLQDDISDIFMSYYEHELTDEELTFLDSIQLKVVEIKNNKEV